ncbi:MAG: accessory factor UbiK family protein [bacterium]|nr:accessory factor UbiK family protein [bacterium]
MPQTTSKVFDEIAKLMTDAAGAMQGARGEVDNAMRSKAEKVLRDLDIVQREEFDAVKAMATKAREENDELRAEIKTLRAQIKVLK